MSRETFVVLCAAAAAMCGCQSSKVKISGRIVGTEPRNIYLEEVTPLRQTIVDSTVLAADGSYLFRLRDIAASPSLYNVVYDNERIPLLVEGGDRVTVNSAGSVVRNYTVEGSAESELLREFYQAFVVGAQHLDEIASRFAEPNLSEERHREPDEGVHGRVFPYPPRAVALHRREQVFAGGGLCALSASAGRQLPVQRRRGRGLLPYGGRSRGRTLSRLALRRGVAGRGGAYGRAGRAGLEGERAELPRSGTDRHVRREGPPLEGGRGKGRAAGLLVGRGGHEQCAQRRPGRRLYAKYAGRGFEVYQVGIDTSKPLWITAVQEQQLPWKSVTDLRGRASSALVVYNVQRIPANFLIDREGTIVGKNLYGRSLEEKLEQLLP